MNYIPFFSFYQKQNEPVLIEEEELPSTSMESMNSFQPISSYFDLSANTIKKIGSTEKIQKIEPCELVEPIEHQNEFQEVIEVKIHIPEPEPEHHSYDIDVDIDVGDIIKNAILDLFRN